MRKNFVQVELVAAINDTNGIASSQTEEATATEALLNSYH